MHPSPSFRDRTYEFRSAVHAHLTPLILPPAADSHSDFTRRASNIGLRISHTSHKLARLAKLAKTTSVFDDPALEIQELTALVKKDIGALSNAVMDLQALCDSHNEGGTVSKDTADHSAKVVDSLKTRLMCATTDFKQVLTMRTENLKVHENRRQMFSSSAAKDASNPFMRQGPLVAREASDAAPPAPWAPDSATTPFFQRKNTNGASSPSTPAFVQQQQQQHLAVQHDSYMQSRAEALQNVESTVHELSNIFTQLATMVSHQGELAIRIDENMEEAEGNIERAQGQLLKYLNSISSKRLLMMKMFFVLMVFVMIFIFFVA